MSTERKSAKIDWLLLLFLVLFTNQAVLSLKLLGLFLIYLARPNFNFGFNKGRVPKFYIYIVILALVNLVIRIREFTYEYLVAFSVGTSFWLFAFLGFHQVKLSIEKNDSGTINKTLKLYTALNLLFCFVQLGMIMKITGRINPYTGLQFPYGMSTGDNIYGILWQGSYYNMMISSMLAVYFIFNRQIWYAVLSTIAVILVYGNVGTIIFFSVMLAIFLAAIAKNIFNKNDSRIGSLLQRITPPAGYHRYILPILMFGGVIYALISPENYDYLKGKIESKVFAEKSNDEGNLRTIIQDQKVNPKVFDMYYTGNIIKEEEEKRQKVSTVSSKTILRGAGATTTVRRNAKQELTTLYIERLQGKVLSVLETKQYLLSSPGNFLFGAGPVRFSSTTALKMAGYDSSRIFMNVLPRYKSELYAENHELIIDTRTKSRSEFYSNANWPDSFYNQIFGEYGVLGFLLFTVFYIRFFWKRAKHATYSIWLLLMLIPFAHITYMFEQLCVIVFFELLIETDIKNTEQQMQNVHAG